MPLYDADHRLKSDTCSLADKQADNDRVVHYQTHSFRPPCDEKPLCSMTNLLAENRNIIPWDGYGLDPCVIDNDSALYRNPVSLTHHQCRQQLPNRIFQAVPMLARGTVLPALESRMQSGVDTTNIRQCKNVKEKMWPVFHPNMCRGVQNPERIIQPWTWGGESSRDIARSDCFLRQLGYEHDGRIWRQRA